MTFLTANTAGASTNTTAIPTWQENTAPGGRRSCVSLRMFFSPEPGAGCTPCIRLQKGLR